MSKEVLFRNRDRLALQSQLCESYVACPGDAGRRSRSQLLSHPFYRSTRNCNRFLFGSLLRYCGCAKCRCSRTDQCLHVPRPIQIRKEKSKCICPQYSLYCGLFCSYSVEHIYFINDYVEAQQSYPFCAVFQLFCAVSACSFLWYHVVKYT